MHKRGILSFLIIRENAKNIDFNAPKANYTKWRAPIFGASCDLEKERIRKNEKRQFRKTKRRFPFSTRSQHNSVANRITGRIVFPGTLHVMRHQKQDKILQYGERIWGITSGTIDERIDLAIEKTESFFRSLGLATRLSEENIGSETIQEIERRFNERHAAFGENQNIDGKTARRILESVL